MKVRLILFLILGILYSYAGLSQPDEMMNKRKELNELKRQFELETQELKRFKRNTIELEAAYMRKDSITVNKLKNQVQSYMQSRVAQLEREIGKDKQELIRSKRELDTQKKEIEKGKPDLSEVEGHPKKESITTSNNLSQKQKDLDNKMHLAVQLKSTLNKFNDYKFTYTGRNDSNDNKGIKAINMFTNAQEANLEITKRKIEEQERKLREEKHTPEDNKRPPTRPDDHTQNYRL